MMKHAKALLTLIAWAALSGLTEGGLLTDETWVSNQSSRWITAAITYEFPGSPGLPIRGISPQGADHAVYDKGECEGSHSTQPIDIEIWLGNAPSHGHLFLSCDSSIVGFDSTTSDGVDIYKSVYGQINKPQGSPILTIYP